MKCKLTGIEGKEVDAHIIPKSFHSIDPDERLPSRILSNIEGQHPKKTPKGIYDRSIVTEEGERIFSDWDNYAAKLLLKKETIFEPIRHNGEILAYQVAEYDYIKLKLFFLSVLWKASVSSLYFFRKVNLGSHEPRIRKALLSGNPFDTDWYPAIIAKWADDKRAGMMDPFKEKFDGVKYYRMYIGSYIVYYKVDQRLAGKTFRPFQLAKDSPLFIFSRELNESKELPILQKIVKMHAK